MCMCVCVCRFSFTIATLMFISDNKMKGYEHALFESDYLYAVHPHPTHTHSHTHTCKTALRVCCSACCQAGFGHVTIRHSLLQL